MCPDTPPEDGQQPPAREVMSTSDVGRALRRIAHEIVERNKGAEDVVLLGIPSRGVELAHRLADLVAEEGLSRADALQLIEGFREALRSRGAIELDEDVYGDAAALSGVSKFSARVKCAMLAWVALEDAIAKA